MGREGPSCVGRITSRPPDFPRVFDAWEIFLDLVWRNATTHGSPENILILWYIGDGWEYELRLYFYKGRKTFDIREKIPAFL